MRMLSLKQITTRGAAYAAIGASLYLLSAGNASAWGPWGGWAAPNTYGSCSGPALPGKEACNGWSYGVSTLLEANASYALSVWATAEHNGRSNSNVNDRWGGDSTAMITPVNIVRHACICDQLTAINP